jgi:hypothetical protein
MTKYLKALFLILIVSQAFSQTPSNIRQRDIENPTLLTVSSAKYDKYQLKDFVRAGAKVRIGNELDRFDVKEIIRLNPNLVTVVGTRFDKFDMKDFVRAGAYVLISNKFDKYDAKEIISLNPSLVTVIATGFDKYAINEFIKAGAKVVIGED